MNTLKEVYDLYRENEPNATVIEERCLQTGCEGDIYRARIAKLEKQIEENARNYGDWQHRAERAEKTVNAIVEQLKANMVYRPENAWQLGYRAATISIIEVIRPPSEANRD